MAGHRPIVLLRRLLFLVLLGLLGGLVALYLLGRQPALTPAEVSTASPSQIPDRDTTFIGTKFTYRFDEGGRTLLTVAGDSFRRDRGGGVFLDKMSVSLFPKDSEPFTVASEKGSWDEETAEALLETNVVVTGPSGLGLASERLQLTDKGHVILSPGPLTFNYGESAEGRANRMRADLESRFFLLGGDVVLESGPAAPGPFALHAARLFLDRLQHRVRADGGVTSSFLSHRLRAQKVNLWLSEDEKFVQFVRAVGRIQGRVGAGATGADAGPIRFAGIILNALFNPGSSDLRRIELVGTVDEPATLLSTGGGDPPRRLVASFLSGDLEGGGLSRVQALDGVKLAELTETPPEEALDAAAGEAPEEEGLTTPEDRDTPEERPDAPLAPGGPPEGKVMPLDHYDETASRLVTGGRAEAALTPEGNLAHITLFERVRFRDRELSAEGDEVRFDFGTGIGEFVGKPVRAKSSRGNLTAPRVLYTQRTGLVVAQGGTRTEIRPAADHDLLAEGPLASGEGPLWVESQEAFFRGTSRSFLFRGKVKAWRGENLILADELKGDDEGEQLTATGAVRTDWKPAPRTAERDPLPSGPLEVTAGAMLYRKSAGTLLYRGDVHAVQGGRRLACDEMTVKMAADQRIESVLLQGKVEIEDPATGRIIQGDRARYLPGEHSIEVEGQKVRLRDRAGAEITGRRVIYDFTTGKAQVASGGDKSQ